MTQTHDSFDHAAVARAHAVVARAAADARQARPVLDLVVEHARRAIGAEGSIYVTDPDRRWLQEACTSWPEPPGGRPFGTGVAGVCAESRRGLVVNDYPAWSNRCAAAPASTARDGCPPCSRPRRSHAGSRTSIAWRPRRAATVGPSTSQRIRAYERGGVTTCSGRIFVANTVSELRESIDLSGHEVIPNFR